MLIVKKQENIEESSEKQEQWQQIQHLQSAAGTIYRI